MERTKDAAKAAKNAASPSSQTHTSVLKLVTFFCAWKVVLLAVAAASPGPGYDTSTQLLLLRRAGSTPGSPLSDAVEHLVSKLTRWDAIYFASSSERGQVFEQEWAFSGTFAKLTSALVRVFPSNLCRSDIACHALAGIVTSHVAHLLAVLCLYELTYESIPSNHDRKLQIAFTTACLHILSPAGLFLSAPYGESLSAAAHFAGLLCYVLAKKQHPSRTLPSLILTLLSGLFIGYSSTIRSNGLLSGSIFAWDAILYLPQLPTLLEQRLWPQLLRFCSILLAGLIIAIGYILPQITAYQEYCTLGNSRPWCNKFPPSIYTFVQTHYWNVGFLQYWTLSNLPLFALAAPMLVLLSVTAISALDPRATRARTSEEQLYRTVLARLALPQLLLTILATTSFHVQIINRISSGYPVWYILVAGALCGNGEEWMGGLGKMLWGKTEWIVRGGIVYAVVQGGLYASFMPPA